MCAQVCVRELCVQVMLGENSRQVKNNFHSRGSCEADLTQYVAFICVCEILRLALTCNKEERSHVLDIKRRGMAK
jgi:hypothetical protein